ncbi:hypothetical protein A3B21_04905 [Candidatus Uhrbacteria bacterium RIFCSPLOWO2_01_FULL_47_24]|uniref:Uncharacterized protein n=1 Tax=Candidatus Uhrbacteria bacterium RIFCSPLOWO2_01_FULL_47_24 TaxID=1802401 RepID=A0A1F7UWE1_9BACT|nr:MAG: hypothetical protein A2753_02940 [Candidatus Uhrbacteria bacterium RIFCSPHIGHO2_01_FULL_47_11]OGL82028.1 MAG: hypothetical protein A3B21_04905 [Candidatus Uhrbacteria bacterium RIFCSPLOWO2_01_FULL_47_24]OGL85422.1 MAG: hypothetical protein A3J03_05070 [Candidatus Uhrbacteria bacterium RIFCSPLOWO2_02_FULL_46_25]OGL92261.1 MAG: hypothetical protein A3H11_01935 [Candidatus Uhrbacteria bacterium RIFCSPLOWO2_12_FULL_47_10]
MFNVSILRHKSQEAASAASWEYLKNFSFLLLQNMVPAQILFERGSLRFLSGEPTCASPRLRQGECFSTGSFAVLIRAAEPHR